VKVRKCESVCFFIVIILFINPVLSQDVKKASITFGGDVVLGGYYGSPRYGTMDRLVNKIDSLYCIGGAELVVNDLFKDIKVDFQDVDYSVVNLEGPITPDLPKYVIEQRMINKFIPMRQVEQTPEILKAAGIDLVSLANNHMYDYELKKGLKFTTKQLDSIVDYVGVGIGDGAYKPVMKNINGINVAFFGVSDVLDPDSLYAHDGVFGIAGIPEQGNYETSQALTALLYFVRKAEKENDFTVVMLHAGPISGSKINERQRVLVDTLLKSGVDIIAGAHSHYIQPIREIEDNEQQLRQVAFYCLGNLIFGGRQGRQAISMLATVTLYKTEDDGNYLTYITKSFNPNPDTTFVPVFVKGK